MLSNTYQRIIMDCLHIAIAHKEDIIIELKSENFFTGGHVSDESQAKINIQLKMIGKIKDCITLLVKGLGWKR